MYNRTYKNDQGVKVSGAAANNHLLKKYIEEDNIVQFVDNQLSDDFKSMYIKSPQDMEKAVNLFKIYYNVSVSNPDALLDVGSPYIIDKEFVIATLNHLNYQYRDGNKICNGVVLEVW
ncbi:hypothetical protein [Bacillus cereus]|uniref:hypothetical protein n=1 Tax=Bacillus cereus TaxID=1396 RepID=UPI000BF6946A|nr:hypothetical protein [Bacillus cereus]PFN26797.1 hypothetical protein COJ69_01000 [Bacillus cereus]